MMPHRPRWSMPRCDTGRMPTTPAPGPLPAAPAPRERGPWDAWDPEPARLPGAARAIIATVVPGTAHPVPRRARPALTPSLLGDDDLASLEAIVGAGAATRDDDVRALHLGGKSTPDLLRRRLDDPQHAPDAVVSP